MLTTIAVIFVILWLLGIGGIYTIGWAVHFLLLAAIIIFIIRALGSVNTPAK